MDYLLTWNCKHIANAQIQGKLAEISLDFGNYDLDAIFADLRKKKAASGRQVVTLSRKLSLITRWSGLAKNLGGDRH